MGREVKDTRNDKSGGTGGDDLEDGLDKASERASQLSNEALARLFIEANAEARNLESPPVKDLFVEEKEVHHIEEAEPDPVFLQQVYDSLSRKEIHHKKLLEENIPASRILQLVHYFKRSIKIPVHREEAAFCPINWKVFAIFWKSWRKATNTYVGNFASLTDLYLRKQDYAKFMLKWEFIAMFLILALCCPIIVLFSKNTWAVGDHIKNLSQGWSSFIFSTSIISCIMATAPIFVFLCLWFVNVNRLHNSKYFHLFLFGSFTLAFIFMAIAIFNTGLFYWVDYKWNITSTFQATKK